MAHLADEEYLNRENIDEYMNALAESIVEAGIGKHKILIVGGAAMALKYHDGRSTVDIDICFREQNHMYSCCKKIADKYGLPNDWINSDVMHSESFSYGLFENAIPYKTFCEVLEVYVADDIDIYCMKLVSFRPKDIQDMEVLAGELKNKGVTPDIVIKNFNRLYGDEFLLMKDQRKRRFMETQLR